MQVLIASLAITFVLWGQKSQYILVKLKKAPDITVDNALLPSWEERSVRLRINEELEDAFVDIEEEETDRSIAECFIPQFKLITERYTYIISLACQNLVAFQNSAPFKPSDRRVQSPISFTEDLRYFIEKSVEKHFKLPARRLYAEYSLAYVPPTHGSIRYDDLDILVNQAQVLEEEDDTDIEPDEPSESAADWMSEDDLEVAH